MATVREFVEFCAQMQNDLRQKYTEAGESERGQITQLIWYSPKADEIPELNPEGVRESQRRAGRQPTEIALRATAIFSSGEFAENARRNMDFVQLDGTGRVIYENYRVIVCCTRGKHNTILPIGFGIVDGETTSNYADVIARLKHYVEDTLGGGFIWQPKYVMSDAAYPIKVAVGRIFGDCRHARCYWHFRHRDIPRHPSFRKLSQNTKQILLRDIENLHLCLSKDVFEAAAVSMLHRWAGMGGQTNALGDCLDYFREHAINGWNSWYLGFLPAGYPCANSPCESLAASLKRWTKNSRHWLIGFCRLLCDEVIPAQAKDSRDGPPRPGIAGVQEMNRLAHLFADKWPVVVKGNGEEQHVYSRMHTGTQEVDWPCISEDDITYWKAVYAGKEIIEWGRFPRDVLGVVCTTASQCMCAAYSADGICYHSRACAAKLFGIPFTAREHEGFVSYRSSRKRGPHARVPRAGRRSPPPKKGRRSESPSRARLGWGGEGAQGGEEEGKAKRPRTGGYARPVAGLLNPSQW